MRRSNTAQKDDRGRSQAVAQFSSIEEMVKRLNHSAECTGENCTLDAKTLRDIGYKDKPTEDELRRYHDQDEAGQAIDDDPLSIEVRSGWVSLGDKGEMKPEEFCILLCTGGPAVRIVGTLNEHDYEPESPRLEYQDWGTPWTEYSLDSDQEEVLLDYCRHFYFGS